MFTGLVQEKGTIRKLDRTGSGVRWTIAAPKLAPELAVGDSVNIAGACQTVETVKGDLITGTSIPATLQVTTYGTFRIGDTVNLEPALRMGDRLGGHLVSGHVDTTGHVREARRSEDGYRITIAFDTQYDHWVLDKGSIAIDGVSLTIADARPGYLEVALIPETLERTTLGNLRSGDRVNLEFDQMIKAAVAAVERTGVTEELLTRSGY